MFRHHKTEMLGEVILERYARQLLQTSKVTFLGPIILRSFRLMIL